MYVANFWPKLLLPYPRKQNATLDQNARGLFLDTQWSFLGDKLSRNYSIFRLEYAKNDHSADPKNPKF